MIFWLLKWLARFLLPVLFQNLAKKFNHHEAEQTTHAKYREPDGRIRVDHMPPNPKKNKTDILGDFIDYEEVK